jgi:hypothetical protein
MENTISSNILASFHFTGIDMNKIFRLILMGISILSFSNLVALAEEGSPNTMRWNFDPNVGFEGQASIESTNAVRLEVECGNGGGPSILMTSKSILSKEKMVSVIFNVDGANHAVKFQCFRDGLTCGSFGFPSHAVMNGLQKGMKLEINDIGTFTLKGSRKAISNLSACLITSKISGYF